jgi:hypothetical protein
MTSSGVILYTSGTAPIAVSMPIPESQRRPSSRSPTFSPLSPTSKANAQVFSIFS